MQSLEEVLGQDLMGFQLAAGYYLELKHGLMGFFPAVIRDDGTEREEMVVCLNKASLRKVWDRLPPRSAKITRELLLVHPDQEKGFSIAAFMHYFNYGGNKPGPLSILTEESSANLCEQEKPFAWAPGLVQLKAEEVQVPDFDS